MLGIEIIAERRIREAMERGDFDNLPGKGKPLEKDNIDQLPPEIRACAILLKNSGVIPEEMLLKKEILNLHKLIDACYDDARAAELNRELRSKSVKYSILMERRGTAPIIDYEYRKKMIEKM